MDLERFCVICGTPFDTGNGSRVVCSRECSTRFLDEGYGWVSEKIDAATPEALETLRVDSVDQYIEWREILEQGYSSADGEIYFVMCDDYIKIGYSQDPLVQLSDMQVGNPYELLLLARFPGSRETEKMLHDSFSHRRVRGEWFIATDDIMEFAKGEMVQILKEKAANEQR